MAYRDDIVKAMTNELDIHKVPYTIEHGKRHLKIRFMFGGISRSLIAPLSSKNQARLIHTNRANVRRILLNRLPATGTSGR